MKTSLRLLAMAALVAMLIAICATSSFSQITRYAVTNDDNASANSATFYTIGTNFALTQKTVVSTGGIGLGGGYFASTRVSVVRSPTGCIYVSNGGSTPGSVSGIVESTLTLAGTFNGSSGDNGDGLGIGLAVGSKALYAAFTGSGTIGVYKLGSNCTLTFKKDVPAVGLFGGQVDGMKVHGNILVVAYVDGSVSSFNISTGVPVSNNDLQQSSGDIQFGGLPAGVDISSDGHWAIFGDATGGNALVEVADISSGKIAGTTPFLVGTGVNSNSVWLSPDGTLLYISNNFSGQVTAAFFDGSTGTIGASCMSPVLKNFGATWFFTGSVVTGATSGTGKVVYVAEWGGGNPSSIGIVKATSNGSSCTLTESTISPASDPQSLGLLSVGVFPPRSF
jgi:hypothetical protein